MKTNSNAACHELVDLPATPQDKDAWLLDYPEASREVLHDYGMPPGEHERAGEFNTQLVKFVEAGLLDAELSKAVELLLEDFFGSNPPDPDDDEFEYDGNDVGD